MVKLGNAVIWTTSAAPVVSSVGRKFHTFSPEQNDRTALHDMCLSSCYYQNIGGPLQIQIQTLHMYDTAYIDSIACEQ